MFITRASRRDLKEIEGFYDEHEWFEGGEEPDLKRGTTFIARQGPIIGCVRLIEIQPNQLAVEDVLVHRDHRAKGIGTNLMQAAMNSRGGTLYLCCHEGTPPFYERFGFELIDFKAQPDSVQAYWRAEKAYPTPADHVHLFMRAR